MCKLCFYSQKVFQQSGDLNFKYFSFAANHGSTPWIYLAKQTVKKLNILGRMAADKDAWIKACSSYLTKQTVKN